MTQPEKSDDYKAGWRALLNWLREWTGMEIPENPGDLVVLRRKLGEAIQSMVDGVEFTNTSGVGTLGESIKIVVPGNAQASSLEGMWNSFKAIDYRTFYEFNGETLAVRVKAMNDYYVVAAENIVTATRHFRDDLLIKLEAMKLVVENAGHAETHNEKNARLRGCVEMLEGAVKKLADLSFDTTKRHWYWKHDLFSSDYPKEHLIRRIHELEVQLASAKAQTKPGNVKPVNQPD